MKVFERLKIVLIALVIIILLALALPEFNLSFQGKTFRYPSIGFSKINIPQDFPSLRKGYGIFASQEFNIPITLNDDTKDKTDQFNNILARIEDRAKYASLQDISIQGEVTDGKHSIKVTIPDYYTNKEKYAEWLTAPAKIEILDLSGSNQFSINVFDFRLVNREFNVPVYRETTPGIGSTTEETQLTRVGTINSGNLVISIDKSKAENLFVLTTFSQSVQNTAEDQLSSNYALSIDEGIDFYLYKNENSDDTIRALPVSGEISISSETLNNYLKIVQSYFQEKSPIDYSAEIITESTAVAPEFNNDGGKFLAVSFLIAFFLIGIIILKQIGLKKTIIFGLSNMFVLLVALTALKLVFADISIGLVLGFVIATSINVILVYSYLAIEKNDINKYRRTIFILIFTLLAINFSKIFLGIYIDFLEVMLANSIGLIIATYTIMPWMYDIYINKGYTLTSIFRR